VVGDRQLELSVYHYFKIVNNELKAMARSRRCPASNDDVRLGPHAKLSAMIEGMYWGVVCVLVGLLSIAYLQPLPEGDNVFRFPLILIQVLRVGLFVPPLVGLGIYESFATPSYVERMMLTGFFGTITIVDFFYLMKTTRTHLKLTDGSLYRSTGGRGKTINLSTAKQIVIRRPNSTRLR